MFHLLIATAMRKNTMSNFITRVQYISLSHSHLASHYILNSIFNAILILNDIIDIL